MIPSAVPDATRRELVRKLQDLASTLRRRRHRSDRGKGGPFFARRVEERKLLEGAVQRLAHSLPAPSCTCCKPGCHRVSSRADIDRKICSCSPCIRTKSPGRKRHLTSTRRRITPVFVHGASSQMRSKDDGSISLGERICQSVRKIAALVTPERSRFSRRVWTRDGSRSQAISRPRFCINSASSRFCRPARRRHRAHFRPAAGPATRRRSSCSDPGCNIYLPRCPGGNLSEADEVAEVRNGARWTDIA